MSIEAMVYESDPDDPDYNASDEDSNGFEEVSDEESEGDGDKSGDDSDVVESEDDNDDGDDVENRSKEAGDVEAGNGARRSKAKRKRHESEDEEDKRDRKAKQEKDEEDDIVERFEFEIEESVANWFDEFKINRNSIPESSDEEEDPVVIRDRKIRMGTNDKLAIGRTFFTGYEFKEVVLHHALKSRENIKQDRWGKEKIGFRCAQDKNCGWRLYCTYEKAKQLWVLKTVCGYHRCTPNGKCKLLKSLVIGRLFMDKLRMQPKYMPLDIQRHIKEHWNLLSTIGQLQRGRLLALKLLDQEYAQHFAHLRGYAAEILASNPGSTAVVDTFSNAAGQDVFKRFYVCLGAMKKGFYYCRPIIGIYGTFLKQTVKGCLLTAITHDANMLSTGSTFFI